MEQKHKNYVNQQKTIIMSNKANYNKWKSQTKNYEEEKEKYIKINLTICKTKCV